ncbi:MarR family winged helix-turn-helix transcriptional regulator [Flavobacterium columnare]|uniref:Winged helix-turn-helix transcriptional regulator n=1 Tax=Flavobacterium columnare TaxID=996 RepID=A0AAI8CJ64_9FLAO|nr:MarR family winged helix-turn-helix transcriptional regulator [Flavobacterium columnare]AMO20997.1 winged helix-turn-helix transcriptional regulator [Flavobacterium columnare]AUX18999.1 MarR family transcriptional regulator [Flavobacterium columnare]QOG58077.1 winged helix-turn-helix transcriptional regulator [Flavobacterium columnare]QOG60799.1 winged helix-turn-helix transcriptional regulator [Flavobacterium columnare]QOG63519.1 winged helix-turn-helix transcriptional regulator [Flavobact
MKHSMFNLDEQNQKIESRIGVALERISEAFRVLLWKESKENSLSPIQIQILIFICFHSEEKCKVSYLAEEFNMTKAIISDSIKVLIRKGLLKKETNIIDTRSFLLSLTQEGKKIASKGSFFASLIQKTFENLSEEQKTTVLSSLLKLIYDLQKANIIEIQRMCFTCSFYTLDKGLQYCKLMNVKLTDSEIRADCPEYIKV